MSKLSILLLLKGKGSIPNVGIEPFCESWYGFLSMEQHSGTVRLPSRTHLIHVPYVHSLRGVPAVRVGLDMRACNRSAGSPATPRLASYSITSRYKKAAFKKGAAHRSRRATFGSHEGARWHAPGAYVRERERETERQRGREREREAAHLAEQCACSRLVPVRGPLAPALRGPSPPSSQTTLWQQPSPAACTSPTKARSQKSGARSSGCAVR